MRHARAGEGIARAVDRKLARRLAAVLVCGVTAGLTLLGSAGAYASDDAADRGDVGPSQVAFQVSAAACVVVSADGRVLEVWSNSQHPQVPPQFRREALDGQPIDPTDAMWQAYRSVSWRVSWTRAPGRIFQASDGPLDRLIDRAADTLIGLGVLPG